MRAPRRLPLRLAIATCLAAVMGLALGGYAPAGAVGDQARPASAPAGYHPELDHLGSGVARHFGSHRALIGQVRPDAASLAGLDVSGWQGNVDWATVAAGGAKFAYIKATENTNYQNEYFTQQYEGAYDAGLIRGAYHFAIPNGPSAVAQADYFVIHGGGWSADGRTLPPMLDIEYNPYGDTCYGLSQSAMTSWVGDFLNEVHAKTGRWAVIYTTLDWWSTCTGNTSAFAANDPLFIARYASDAGTLPAGWAYWTFWQFADSGTFPGDQDYFNGDASRLLALSKDTP